MTEKSSSIKTGIGQGIGCLGGGIIVLIVLAAIGGAGSEPSKLVPLMSASVQPSAGSTKPLEGNTTSATKIIASGTWIVGIEILPGTYRVSGYFSRQDVNGDIIQNDGVYDDNELTLMVVKASDSTVEINGEATSIAYFPVYDPIAKGATGGTYLVGIDIQPGRYRISKESYAYAARLDKDLEIISNEGNKGNVVITVKESDYALQFTGMIAPI